MTTYEIISLIINGVIAAAGFSAIMIYKVQCREKIKTAATLVASQIDQIETTIKDLRDHRQLDNTIIYKSKVILSQNYWSENRYLLSRYLGERNVSLIEAFYSQAEELEKSRAAICKELVAAWEHKDFLLQSKIAECADELKLSEFYKRFELCQKIFNPELPIDILAHNLNVYQFLTGTVAYEKLRKISYHS